MFQIAQFKDRRIIQKTRIVRLKRKCPIFRENRPNIYILVKITLLFLSLRKTFRDRKFNFCMNSTICFSCSAHLFLTYTFFCFVSFCFVKICQNLKLFHQIICKQRFLFTCCCLFVIFAQILARILAKICAKIFVSSLIDSN